MPNWATTDYVIEGPKETLEKIYNALEHHDVISGTDNDWEGNILKELGIDWEELEIKEKENTVSFEGYYLRGFIEDYKWENDKHIAIRINAEEAWGLTDFHKLLEQGIPDIKVYYIVEEPGCELYGTNDVEGKYFPDRYYIDAFIEGKDYTEYFTSKEDAFDFVKKISGLETEKEIEAFNETAEDDFIYFHEFDVIQ